MAIFKIRPSYYKVASINLPSNKQQWPEFIMSQLMNKLPTTEDINPVSFDFVQDVGKAKVGIVTLSKGENLIYVPFIVKDGKLYDFVIFIYNGKKYPFTEQVFKKLFSDRSSQNNTLIPIKDTSLSTAPASTVTEEIYNPMADESNIKTSNTILREVAHYKHLIKSALENHPLFNEYKQLLDSIIDKNPLSLFKPDFLIMQIIHDTLYVAAGKRGVISINVDAIPIDTMSDYIAKLNLTDQQMKDLLARKPVIIEKNKPQEQNNNDIYAYQTTDGFYELPSGKKVLFTNGIVIDEEGNYTITPMIKAKQLSSVNIPITNADNIKTGEKIGLIVVKDNQVSIVPIQIGFKVNDIFTATIMDRNVAHKALGSDIGIKKLMFSLVVAPGNYKIDKDNDLLWINPKTKIIKLNKYFEIKEEKKTNKEEPTTNVVEIKQASSNTWTTNLPEVVYLFGDNTLTEWQVEFVKKACMLSPIDATRYSYDPTKLYNTYSLAKTASEYIDRPYLHLEDIYILQKKANLTTDDVLRILGTQTLNTENSSRFISYIGELEKVLAQLADIAFQANLYDNEEVALAAQAVYDKLKDFISTLYKIKGVYENGTQA